MARFVCCDYHHRDLFLHQDSFLNVKEKREGKRKFYIITVYTAKCTLTLVGRCWISLTHLLVLDVWREGTLAGTQVSVTIVLPAKGDLKLPPRLVLPPTL